MKRAAFLLFALTICLVPAHAQKAVSDWFPVHTGDKWIYEHETRDFVAAGQPQEVHRWKTEETIVGSWAVPEGLLVGRSVRIIEGAPPPGWVNPERDQVDLIRGDCIYGKYGEADGSLSSHQLTLQFHEGLNVGYVSPDFCFPLAVHRKWGAAHGLPNWNVARPEDAKDWNVVGMNERDVSAPDRQNTYHIASISSYPGAGETVDIWFEKGVGIVREVQIHHGTPDEQRDHLLRFMPASGR